MVENKLLPFPFCRLLQILCFYNFNKAGSYAIVQEFERMVRKSKRTPKGKDQFSKVNFLENFGCDNLLRAPPGVKIQRNAPLRELRSEFFTIFWSNICPTTFFVL